MNWRKLMKPAIAAFSVVFTAVVTAWVNAEMAGTPLNGMPGIVRFWKRVLLGSVPVWLAFVFIAAALACCVLWFLAYKKRTQGKVRLSIVVLSTPPPRWQIGAMAQTPCMNVSLHAQLAHLAKHSLIIVKGYLVGTECVAPFMPVTVTGPYDESVMVHFGVRPILAKDGQAITRRIVLVDQFGNAHRTNPIRIEPGRHSASQFSTSGNPIQCWFCRKVIALEELAETSAVPAHKSCIK
jgi:hypothetical protein